MLIKDKHFIYFKTVIIEYIETVKLSVKSVKIMKTLKYCLKLFILCHNMNNTRIWSYGLVIEFRMT